MSICRKNWRREIFETQRRLHRQAAARRPTPTSSPRWKSITAGSLHQMTNQDSDSVLQAYLNALAHAYDPHSDYMSAPHAQDFSISMNLALFGIGAQLREDDGYCTILHAGARRAGEQEQADQRKRPHRGRGAGQQAAGGRGGHGSGKSGSANPRAKRHRGAADHQPRARLHDAQGESRCPRRNQARRAGGQGQAD